MQNSFSLNQQAKVTQSLKQTQRMIMSPQMQQAIHLLQMPILELTNTLETELAQNPILESIQEAPDDDHDLSRLEEENLEENEDQDPIPEKELVFNEKDFEVLKQIDEEFRDHFLESGNYYLKRTSEEEKQKNFQLNSLKAEPTLFEHLMNTAKQTFHTPQDIQIAEALIGNFDSRGFLLGSLDEIALLNGFPATELKRILYKIQTFDPYGVGATSLQDSFLIQLRCLKKTHTLAYQIIQNHYDDLLHNRLLNIKKNLKCSLEDIEKAIHEEIAKLDLHPGTTHSREIIQTIVPDASIKDEEGKLIVNVTSDFIPPIRLNQRYMRMLKDESIPELTREFIRQKILSAKWLLRNIQQRNSTIERISQFLTEHHESFFLNTDGQLNPLNLRMVAEHLNLHESTIARAVSGKYIDTPRGLFPLRYFFTNAYITSEGDISSETVRNAIKAIIDGENKTKPLSDLKISSALESQGITCARRTIAKYRNELNLGNAQQRRSFSK